MIHLTTLVLHVMVKNEGIASSETASAIAVSTLEISLSSSFPVMQAIREHMHASWLRMTIRPCKLNKDVLE